VTFFCDCERPDDSAVCLTIQLYAWAAGVLTELMESEAVHDVALPVQ
jgi:hypothetical protein